MAELRAVLFAQAGKQAASRRLSPLPMPAAATRAPVEGGTVVAILHYRNHITS